MGVDGEPLVSVEFELTPEEWVEAGTACAYASSFHRSQRRSWKTSFAVMFGLAGLFSLATSGLGAAVLMAMIGAGFIAAAPALYRRALRRNLAKAARREVTNGLFGPHRLELRSQGMLDVTTAYETLWRWSSIDGVSEAGGTFMIEVGALDFLPIPQTAFRDADAARLFGDVFFEHLARARLTARSDPRLGTAAADPST